MAVIQGLASCRRGSVERCVVPVTGRRRLSSRSSLANLGLDDETENDTSAQNLMIVGICVGATILVLLIAYISFRIRQGTPIRKVFSKPQTVEKCQPSASPSTEVQHRHRSAPPPTTEPRRSMAFSQSGRTCKSLPALPGPAMIRKCSQSSRGSVETGSTMYSPKIEMLPSTPRDFLDDETHSQLKSPFRPRPISFAASSPLLPRNSRRITATTVTEGDAMVETRSVRSVVRDRNSKAYMSRFSWTDSHRSFRQSTDTTRSSGSNFQTVDSWVKNQSNRVEEQRLKEKFREECDEVPVPELPERFKRQIRVDIALSQSVAQKGATQEERTKPNQNPAQGIADSGVVGAHN